MLSFFKTSNISTRILSWYNWASRAISLLGIFNQNQDLTAILSNTCTMDTRGEFNDASALERSARCSDARL